jgi:hypothetical protein
MAAQQKTRKRDGKSLDMEINNMTQQEYVRIVISRPDGGVVIMQFMTKIRAYGNAPTLDHWAESDDEGYIQREASAENIEAEIKRSNIDFTAFEIIGEDDLPADRAFRNAWTRCPVNKIKVDMDKARVIHMGRIREARNDRLAELDKRKYGAEYDAERQALRDLPETFDLTKAATPEELKALIPEELKMIGVSTLK